MKKLCTILLMISALFGYSQDNKKFYGSFSTEMIFSFAAIDNHGNTSGNIMRWAPVINPQAMVNYDFNKNFGLFTGLAIRNVGFIYENPLDTLNHAKFKYRTYNLGIPVGFKIGKMGDFLFFGGYEIEFPFVYKEKEFINEDKVNKAVNWFSSKVEPVQHSLLAGVQLPYGATLKFKYYLSNFHKRSYTAINNGVETKPYDFKSNVFYVSLAWDVFSNWYVYAPKGWKKK